VRELSRTPFSHFAAFGLFVVHYCQCGPCPKGVERKVRGEGFEGNPRVINVAGQAPGFIVTVSPQHLQREKEKARALRKTQWWQRQMAKAICYYCERPIAREQMTLDHIVPLIRGGRSTRGNVVLACKTCNSRKKYLLPLEWEEYLQKLRNEPSHGPNPLDPVGEQEENNP
jgi:5-methylcytosine-specific restriction enzyme A